MPNAKEDYASYLLRFRSVLRDNGRTWIASVQSTATGELRCFPHLDALVQFLRDELGGCEETEDSSRSAAQEIESAALPEKRSPDIGKPLNGPQRRG